MTTGKAIALTRWTFVSKVTSLLFNTLSRFVIAFLPRRKHLLISSQQSGGDGIPVELFQILKDDVVKVLHSIRHQSRDITLPIKVHLVKAMILPVVMY